MPSGRMFAKKDFERERKKTSGEELKITEGDGGPQVQTRWNEEGSQKKMLRSSNTGSGQGGKE